MYFRKLLKAGVALTLATSLAACSAGNQTSTNQTTTQSDKETYKIGLHFELTGAVADYGNTENKAAKLAIKLANEQAGYEKYVGVEYDNKSDQTEAVTIATQLASSDVVGVVGPATSGASAATYPILNGANKVVISPSATQNNITKVDPSNENSEVYAYSFRTTFEDSYQGAAMAQFAFDTLSAKKVVIYGDNSNDYSKGLVEAFDTQFKKLGGEIVSTEYFTSGDTDFSSVLTNIKSKDFDLLYIAGYYNEAGLIIKQARELGIDSTIIGGDGFDSESLITLAGASNLNKVYYTTGYTTVDASEKLLKFVEAFKAEYNEEPSMFAALAFDSTNLLIENIEKVGGDSQALRDSIEKTSFSGVTGDFTFDKTHTPIKTVLVVELVDGVQSSAVSVSPQQ
ncbi:MAG: ABC transporter substrate-binding protein [Erysipelotrichaceae bacterium]|nr:ABC transporter substrate-binding protein [Erysipelotrichaceae bacterium]